LPIENFQSRNSTGTGEDSENCGIREEQYNNINLKNYIEICLHKCTVFHLLSTGQYSGC
jgi:hypothetical protein